MSTQNISKKEKAPLTEAIYQTAQGNNKITNLNYTSEKEKSQVTFFADLDAIAGMLKMIKDCLSVIGDSALEGTTSTEEIGNALYITEITLDTTIADCVHLVEKIRP